MHALHAARQVMAPVPHLERHSCRTATMVLKAAKLLKLPNPILLAEAAYLHDLGKANWPEEMFVKYPLEAHDWNVIKAHPVVSENMAAELWPDVPGAVRALVRGHHERPGGKGYPDGLEEPGIELLLLAACDVYDAVTAERAAYRPGELVSPQDALMEVARFAPARVVAALAGVLV